MDQKRKRAKKNINLSNGAGSGADNIEKSVITIDSLPSEVLQSILELSDISVKSLKPWRLVSKSWNEVCCRILRKMSAVPLNMGEGHKDDFDKFKDLILDRHALFPSDWPNPFVNFKILEASLVTPTLVRFLSRPNVKVTTLEIIHDQDFDRVGIEQILERCKNELTHLEIKGSTHSPFLTLSNKKLGGGGWQSLKSLSLTDTCEASSKPCPHVEFVIALAKSVKFEVLNFDGDLRNMTKVFRNNYHCWDELTRLELTSESRPELTPVQINQFMSWAKEVHFPCLTDFVMDFGDDDELKETSETYTPYLLPLIQKSSQTLKQLSLDFISLRLLPSLPKVEVLYCAMMDDDQIQSITELKFPSLTTVYCNIAWTEVPNFAASKDSESNKKITGLTTFWGDDVPAAVTQELLWCIVAKHFPNLKAIFIQQYVSSSTLHLIGQRLPQLQNIQLKSTTSFELLGTSFEHDFNAKGWPGQEFENSSLLRMTQLTHLTLGNSVAVSRSLVTAVLGKLPKIKFLSFYWNYSFTISDVREHLGHIPNLKIYYRDKEERQRLETLTKISKGVTLVLAEV